jgi:predicted 3-demethylubiquinone-9 3-methyltransferase (glyoxalase superfamily)
MKKITPCLWFDNQAEEAAKFYTTIFAGGPYPRKTKLGKASYYDDASSQASGQPKGSVLVMPFEIDGMPFMALNGGPLFTFSEAVSFVVDDCQDQKEVDYFWGKLTAEGGQESQCGWLKDKFGLSWQVVPKQLNELLSDPDPVKSQNVMKAMLQMKKIDIAKLQSAYDKE